MKTDKKLTISCLPASSLTVIFSLFFLAKIFNKIDWSWLWVFSPLWIPFAVIISIFLIYGIIWLIVVIITLITDIRK